MKSLLNSGAIGSYFSALGSLSHVVSEQRVERSSRSLLTLETNDPGLVEHIRSTLPPGCNLRVIRAKASIDDVALTAGKAQRRHSPYTCSEITPRQRDVLEHLLEGLSNKAIARKLNLSHFTVRNHVSQLMRLIGVTTRKEVIARFNRPVVSD